MANLDEPTCFNRLTSELQEFVLACVCVAGKSAHVQAARLDRFLKSQGTPKLYLGRFPFDIVRQMVKDRYLYRCLKGVGMGKYNLLTNSFRALATDPDLDLHSVSVARLMEFPGFGRKTASFFVLHSQADQRIAVLDTHMRKHLVVAGHKPPSFPPISNREYDRWEAVVVGMAAKAKVSCAEFDRKTWLKYRRPAPARCA